jgi:hypothetical protein
MAIRGGKLNMHPHYKNEGLRCKKFLKYCNSLKFSKDYLINMCDASGWQYKTIFNDVEKLPPVFQFSRRVNQREQVVLWPLSDRHTNYTNVSELPVDNIPFNEKKTCVVWRGRISGTFINNWSDSSVYPNSIFWMESLVRSDNDNEQYVNRINDVKRYKIVSQLNNKKMCDVMFTSDNTEHDYICKSKLKTKLFERILGENMTIDEQRQCKYILAVDGNCYPSGLYWSLLSNSVVFYVEPEWETVIDCGLKPWVHYIPVKPTYEDIVEKIEILESDISMALEIINNAHNYLKPYANNKLRDQLDYLTMCHFNSNEITQVCNEKQISFSHNTNKT